ncbi:MAG TPA: FHA domain-containing protein [Myxococcales bacterium]|nr:FHA domain-containing protein [Myxococcales bacterium]
MCRQCEAFNEPGVTHCTACGYDLFAGALQSVTASGEQPPMDAPDATPPDGSQRISTQELNILALSDEEAAEAGVSTPGNGAQSHPMDRTPPQPYAAHEEAEPPPPPPARRAPEVAAAAGGGAAVARRAPEPPPAPPPAARPAAEPPAAAAEKACSNCGAMNPPAAKFCFDCGTPFAKKSAPAPAAREPPRAAAPPLEPLKPAAKPAPEPPPSIQVDSSIHVDEELGAHEITDSTAESAPVSVEEAPEELPAEEAMPEPSPEPEPEPEPVAAEDVAEPIEEEPQPPFAAQLVVEKGSAQGTAFALSHMANTVGGAGSQIELPEDAFVAPHAATLVFAEDHLAVRDEGSANGVYVKLRDPAELQPGDLFLAGERLFRFEGPVELPRDAESETPFLGAPRPQAAAVRIVEVLAGGKTGRTCHRSGPTIAIGRTGCDMNFPSDGQLAAKHAEIRIEDGRAVLVDLGQGPSGVWLRVRSQAEQPLQAGDLLQIGEQQLRVEAG